MFSVIAVVLPIAAATAQIRTEDECLRLHPQISSPVEYASCAYDGEGAERSMRAAYAKLRSKTGQDHRQLLEKAQSAWIANRDAQCAYEAEGYPGSTMSSASIIACVADANRARAEYLMDDARRWPSEK